MLQPVLYSENRSLKPAYNNPSPLFLKTDNLVKETNLHFLCFIKTFQTEFLYNYYLRQNVREKAELNQPTCHLFFADQRNA